MSRDLFDYWWGKVALACAIAPLIWYVHWQLHGIRPGEKGKIGEPYAWIYNTTGVWGTTILLASLCLLLLAWGLRDYLDQRTREAA